jgi:hypothetical protein
LLRPRGRNDRFQRSRRRRSAAGATRCTRAQPTFWQFRVEQKKDAQLARIPVIAMSASRTSQAAAIDAAAFVAKPLRIPELHSVIGEVVARAVRPHGARRSTGGAGRIRRWRGGSCW